MNLRMWARTNADMLPPYDHIMLFCGYDLTSRTNGHVTVGLSGQGLLCLKDGRASSIIEDLGGFQCVKTAAHELGHNMGAKHDGNGNNCNVQDAYIMSSSDHHYTESNKLNGWRFSACSVNYFNIFFTETLRTTGGSRCLYQTETISREVPSVASLLPGQFYGADEQCRQIFGPSSYVCRTMLVNVSNFCPTMWCKYISTKCVRLVAARGTTCGNKRWCIAGQCVYDRSAPSVPDNCPLGNSPRQRKNWKNCTTYINEAPGLCYEGKVRKDCCSACAAQYRTVRNCEYGDKIMGCKAFYCTTESDRQSCCRTCNYGKTFTTTTMTFPTTSTTLDPALASLGSDSNSTTASTAASGTSATTGTNGSHPHDDEVDRTSLIKILGGVGVSVAAAAAVCVQRFRKLRKRGMSKHTTSPTTAAHTYQPSEPDVPTVPAEPGEFGTPV